MYGFGLLGLLAMLAIVGLVFIKPQLALLPSASERQERSDGISGARDICISSAKAAYAMDLQIAGVQCPASAGGMPEVSCVQRTSEGARAYAKFISADKGCGGQ